MILYGIINHGVLYMGWAGFLSSMEEHADSAKIYDLARPTRVRREWRIPAEF